jgi:hypothetical protein
VTDRILDSLIEQWVIICSGGIPPMHEEEQEDTVNSHAALKAIGWVSVGLGIAAVGVFVGRELKKRYEFNHRTPYDFYSNAGTSAVSEFGMGV